MKIERASLENREDQIEERISDIKFINDSGGKRERVKSKNNKKRKGQKRTELYENYLTPLKEQYESNR